ncbi:MAG: hypothetical protein H6Q73_286 [Firmicutes bacterium]|nr:hypothetical protein [Bacillota bacterium]
MKKVLRYLTHWILSLTTTFMIMIAPVAAIVYAADSMNESLSITDKFAFLSVPVDSKAMQNRNIVNSESHDEAATWLGGEKKNKPIEIVLADKRSWLDVDGERGK